MGVPAVFLADLIAKLKALSENIVGNLGSRSIFPK